MRRSLCLLLLCVACDDPRETLADVIEDARACDADDTCVVAGNTDCTCGQPVNSDRVEEVQAAADRVSCCDLFGACVQVDCAGFADLRCEGGRCIGD